MKMREQNADVMFLADLSTPEWMSEGDKVVMLDLEEYTLSVNGMVRCGDGRHRLVSSFRENVAELRNVGTHNEEQEVDRTRDEHWCLPAPSDLPMHANAERRE